MEQLVKDIFDKSEQGDFATDSGLNAKVLSEFLITAVKNKPPGETDAEAIKKIIDAHFGELAQNAKSCHEEMSKAFAEEDVVAAISKAAKSSAT